MQEKRINKILLSCWNNLKAGNEQKSIPSLDQIKESELKDLWDDCFVINFDTKDYDYLGKNIKAIANGTGMVAKNIYENLLSPESNNLQAIIEQVITSESPLIQDAEFTNEHNVNIKYRRCFLPIKDEKGNTSLVLGGIRWIYIAKSLK